MTTTKTAVASPDREPRCRMYSRRGNPCANPALDSDPNAIQICVRHAGEVLELIRERQANLAVGGSSR